MICEECKRQAQGLTVLDAPQLFEAGLEDDCYKVIAVLADKETRINRIMKRDNIDREAALLRISAQYDDDFFIDNCDYVIYNNDGENPLTQTENILEVIL